MAAVCFSGVGTIHILSRDEAKQDDMRRRLGFETPFLRPDYGSADAMTGWTTCSMPRRSKAVDEFFRSAVKTNVNGATM
jgi:hypothetical protein